MKKFLTLLFLVFASSSYGQKMIDIGYHNLFVSDRGPHNASFTVVFESGGGGGADDWEKVIAGLPPEIRTIAYDRSGTGRSEHGPEPATMAQEVFELHNLLKALRVRGNIILTGQSFGGLLVRLYAGQYGTNVAGIVLVDPAHESGLFGSLKYGGWVRLRETAEGKPVPPPQLKYEVSPGYDSTADYMAEEFQNIYLSQLKDVQSLKDRPLIILCAGIRNPPPGTPDEQWKKIRAERDSQVEELTALSSNSLFIKDPLSTHQIQNDNPKLVAESILMVISSIKNKTKLHR